MFFSLKALVIAGFTLAHAMAIAGPDPSEVVGSEPKVRLGQPPSAANRASSQTKQSAEHRALLEMARRIELQKNIIDLYMLRIDGAERRIAALEAKLGVKK